MSENALISQHAMERFTERTWITTQSEAMQITSEALLYGLDRYAFRYGPMAAYMIEKGQHGLWPIAYKGLLFLFDGRILVTTYPLPDWFIAGNAVYIKPDSLWKRLTTRLRRALHRT